VIVLRRACYFQAPSPLAPWDHSSVLFNCYVRFGVGYVRGVQVARACPPW
jgi:hypothetical protein